MITNLAYIITIKTVKVGENMISIQSGVENQIYEYKDVAYILSVLGFKNGDMEFEKTYLDYPLKQQETAYAILRIPVFSEIGSFDEPGAKVRIGKPFIHYQSFDEGLAQEGLIADMDQVEPQIDHELTDEATQVMEQVDKALLQ